MTMTTHNPEATRFNHQQPDRRCGRVGRGPGSFGWRQAPVNIEDKADAYIVNLYAAGLDKSGFHVSAQGDVLCICYTAAQVDDGARTFTRRENWLGSFQREIALNSLVQIDAIAASYVDGVLTIRLPKTVQAQEPGREVPVQ